MTDSTFGEFANALGASNAPIGIVDTCCLLDIVQAPTRPKGQDVAQAAVRLRDRLAKDGSTVMVLPTPVEHEFSRRLDAVQEEVVVAGRKASAFIEKSAAIGTALCLQDTPRLTPSLDEFGLEKQLSTLAEEIIALAHGVPEDPAFDWVARAYHRVVNRTPPASPGKEAMSDCLIFEQALDLARALQAVSFKRRVVFATSNTSDFCDKSRRPLPELMQEASEVGLLLVTGLMRLEFETR